MMLKVVLDDSRASTCGENPVKFSRMKGDNIQVWCYWFAKVCRLWMQICGQPVAVKRVIHRFKFFYKCMTLGPLESAIKSSLFEMLWASSFFQNVFFVCVRQPLMWDALVRTLNCWQVKRLSL